MHNNSVRLPLRCSRQTKFWTFLFASSLMIAQTSCKSDDSKAPQEEQEISTENACPWDDNDTLETAAKLNLDQKKKGFLCPLGDLDYYAFTVPSDQTMIKVDLVLKAIASAINPTYIIYSEDGSTVIAQPDRTESAGIEAPLSIIHPIDPGDYIIQIHDEGKDATDNYHPYFLTLTGLSDNDGNEPNNDAASAKKIEGKTSGYLSYRGDEDWYSISASDNAILNVSLAMSDDSVAPAYRIEDDNGNELVIRTNTKGDDAVNYLEPLSGTGDYYLIVYNDDELSHDPDKEYTLSVSVVSDPDSNEPNDTAKEATRLQGGAATCGQEWTRLTKTGYIATSGDTDWYRLDLSGCTASVVDVAVDFANPGSLPEDFQAAVRLIVPAAGNGCSTDQQCHELAHSACVEDIDCSGIGNNCTTTKGVCSGASTCVPGGLCGALLISRNSADLETSDPEYDPGAPATPGSVKVGAPLFGVSAIYVVVEDYKGDALSIDHSYTLTVQVAKDTDLHEPSEVYLNEPMARDVDSNLDLSPHQELATTVPVEDCTADPSTCCSNLADWTEGAISYTFDQDWYRYDHPCPESDCMLKLFYEVDGGPTDVLMAIYRGSSVWYDTIIPVSDTGNQGAIADTCGDDECLYAYRDHSDYYFNVRDTIFVSEQGEQNNGIWDWDKDQKYRFCIAKYANECQAPCKNDAEYGCGQPDQGL